MRIQPNNDCARFNLSEPPTQNLAANLAAVRRRIAAAACAASRDPMGIGLIGVGKGVADAALRAAAQLGLKDFGESYLQEALPKMAQLADLPVTWHFIGPLQSNKTRPVAERFAWVHSVDRLKLAQRLSAQRPASLPPLQVCLQVNVSGEASKSGATESQLAELAQAVARLPRLQLRGLMAIPAPAAGLDAQRVPFARLRGMLENLNASGLALDTLSMGMSADLEAAILEGANWVRVGTALFGARTKPAVEQQA